MDEFVIYVKIKCRTLSVANYFINVNKSYKFQMK